MSIVKTTAHEKGFTLVELIIATVLGAVVVLGLATVLVGPHTLWRRGGTLVELQNELSLGMERIAVQLREAKWVTVTNAGEVALFETPTGSGRIYRQGSSLVIERESSVDDDIGLLSELSFAPYAGRIGVKMKMARAGETVEGESTIELRNLNILLHCPCTEGQGNVLFDHSGWGNNGALFYCKWVSDGVRFRSSYPSYCEIPDSSALDTGERVVWEFHIRYSPGGSSWPTLYNRGARSKTSGFHWVFIYASSGRIAFQGSTGTSYQTLTSEPLQWESGRLYRVVVLIDNLNKIASFWRDGEHAGTVSYSIGFKPADSGQAYIGILTGYTQANSPAGWNGDIEEVILGSG